MKSITVKTSKMSRGALQMRGAQRMTATFATEGGLTLHGVPKSVSSATLKRVTATLEHAGYAVPCDARVELSPRNSDPAYMTDYYDLPLAICLIGLCSQVKMKGLTTRYICGKLDFEGNITDSNTLFEKGVHSLKDALALLCDDQQPQTTLL